MLSIHVYTHWFIDCISAHLLDLPDSWSPHAWALFKVGALDPGERARGAPGRGPEPARSLVWVAVEESKLSYHSSKTNIIW